jgi:hypothetical protein
MYPMTQMLAQERINDLHRTASRARAARKLTTRRTQPTDSARRWSRRLQISTGQ